MLPIFNTFISPKAVQLAQSVLSSNFLSEGRLVSDFETQLSEQLGILSPVAVNSGTAALHLAVILAGVKSGDEVILPAQTFIATGLAIKYVGATPVFADIDYLTGNISADSIKSKLTRRTSAIIVVHWAGLPCEMDQIIRIGRENSLPIIEDAAHALGARYKESPIGTISDFTCFSFQAIKHLTTGDGGAVACKKEGFATLARNLRWFGIDRAKSPMSLLGERVYNATELGFKYHLNDYSAALGIANLEGFKTRQARLSHIASSYDKHLSNTPGLTLWDRPTDRVSANWLYGMHVERRDDFVRAMKSRNITASVVHQRIDRNKIFGGLQEDLVNQEKFDATQIHIPIHNAVSDDDINHVISSIKKGW